MQCSVLCLSVCLSVTLVDYDHIGWNRTCLLWHKILNLDISAFVLTAAIINTNNNIEVVNIQVKLLLCAAEIKNAMT